MNTNETSPSATQQLNWGDSYAIAVGMGDLREKVEQLQVEMTQLKLGSNLTQSNFARIDTPGEVVLAGSSMSSSFGTLTWLSNMPEKTGVAQTQASQSQASVPLHALLKFVGSFMAIGGISSLAFWLADLPAPLTPFVALLTIVASPFVIGMGFAASR